VSEIVRNAPCSHGLRVRRAPVIGWLQRLVGLGNNAYDYKRHSRNPSPVPQVSTFIAGISEVTGGCAFNEFLPLPPRQAIAPQYRSAASRSGEAQRHKTRCRSVSHASVRELRQRPVPTNHRIRPPSFARDSSHRAQPVRTSGVDPSLHLDIKLYPLWDHKSRASAEETSSAEET
jgi:hypothetical protein